MTDPVKALLEACEPFEHVAEHDISDGEADADWFVVSFSCPRRLTVRDFRALSRAASVLRERGGGDILKAEAEGYADNCDLLTARVKSLETAMRAIFEALNSDPPDGGAQKDVYRDHVIYRLDGQAMYRAINLAREALANAPAHISRTSGSAGREWLPIESAPEDGTEIILWWPRHALDDEDNSTDEIVGGACAISSWVGGWYEPEYISGHGLHMDDDWCYAAEPTHWMPLPKAPVLALFPAPGKETT